jgi:hypothetical protein
MELFATVSPRCNQKTQPMLLNLQKHELEEITWHDAEKLKSQAYP